MAKKKTKKKSARKPIARSRRKPAQAVQPVKTETTVRQRPGGKGVVMETKQQSGQQEQSE